MKALTPIQRRERKPYRHKKSEGYRQAVRRKPEAFHRFVQWGCIAQGLLQYLSLGRGEEVWRHVRSWMRTRRTGNPPSGAGGSIRVAFQPGGISGECAGKPSTQENPRRKPDEAESPRLPNGSVSGGTRANASEVGTHKVNNYIYLFSLPGFF